MSYQDAQRPRGGGSIRLRRWRGRREPLKIGVLALQGDFEAHGKVLRCLGAEAAYVRYPDELAGVDGLVLPGGESTVLLRLGASPMMGAIRDFAAAGKPVFGTCAGAILLAKRVISPAQESLGLVDITIERNAYGRQLASHVAWGASSLKKGPMEMVFIRAPRIRQLGKGLVVLAECEGEPAAVQDGSCIAATFHPELTPDPTLHKHFLALV